MTTFTNGQILTAAEMNALAAAALGGTVTSVALSMPGDFAVAGSPVTNAGTLAVSRTTQGANLVQAGPAAGGAAVPGYRALVAADLPPAGDSMTFQAGRFYTANGIATAAAVAYSVTASLIAGNAIYRSERDRAANPELSDRRHRVRHRARPHGALHRRRRHAGCARRGRR